MNTNPSILVSRFTFFYSPLFFSVQFMEESFLITLGLSVFTLKRETALIQKSRRLLLWMSLDSSSTTCEQCNKVCTIRSRTFRRLFHLVCQLFCSYFYFSNDPFNSSLPHLLSLLSLILPSIRLLLLIFILSFVHYYFVLLTIFFFVFWKTNRLVEYKREFDRSFGRDKICMNETT